MQPKRSVLLGLVMATLVMAADAGETLPVSVAVGSFRGARGLTTLEIYLEVPRADLNYKKQGRRYNTELGTAILLKFEGQIVEFAYATLKDRVATESATTRGVATSTSTLSVRPGVYDLQVVVEDGDQRSFEQTIKVTAPVYSDRNLDMSTVQLAHSVRWASPVAATSRLGLSAVPNAAGVWQTSSAWLWYFLEVYGLATADTVILATSVWQDTTLVQRSQPWHYAVPSAALTERGALNLQSLPPGQYQLIVEAWAEGATVKRQTDFTLVAPDSAVSDTVTVWNLLTKGERRTLGTVVGSAWSQFNAKRYRGMNADDQLAELDGAVDITGLSIDDLIRRWRQAEAFDAARYRRKGLSLQAGLIMRSGIPHEVRVAPATYLQPELQRWSYGAEGPRYFFKDLSGRGYFAIVDSGHVPQQYLSTEAVNWPPDSIQVTVASDTSAAADTLGQGISDSASVTVSPTVAELSDSAAATDTLAQNVSDSASVPVSPTVAEPSDNAAATDTLAQIISDSASVPVSPTVAEPSDTSEAVPAESP